MIIELKTNLGSVAEYAIGPFWGPFSRLTWHFNNLIGLSPFSSAVFVGGQNGNFRLAQTPYGGRSTAQTSSQKLGRHASRRVRSVWKSFGRVSFGSKKFGPKILIEDKQVGVSFGLNLSLSKAAAWKNLGSKKLGDCGDLLSDGGELISDGDGLLAAGVVLRIWLIQGKEKRLLAKILEILEKARKPQSRQNSTIKVRKCERKKTWIQQKAHLLQEL